MSDLSHFNKRGEAHMVDVGGKEVTARRARASGRILVSDEVLKRIRAGDHKKGDVLNVARIAGIMAAKKTAELVPLCHPVDLSHITVAFDALEEPSRIECEATVETNSRTGVEMEALTAVQAALLTVYDMCKSLDRAMVIDRVRLEEKSGGRSGRWRREK